MFAIETASPAFDAQFNLGNDKLLIHYLRLRLHENEPLVLEETWMPRELFPNLRKEVLFGSIMQYMENQGYVISHDFKTIQAVTLSTPEATILGKVPGALSLQITHHVHFLKSILAQITIETQGDNGMNALSIRER